MTSLRQLVNAPCVKCARDTLHIANACHACGEMLALTPRDELRDFDPTVSHEKRAKARAARALAKARTAKLNSQPRSTSARAQYMREWRLRQKV